MGKGLHTHANLSSWARGLNCTCFYLHPCFVYEFMRASNALVSLGIRTGLPEPLLLDNQVIDNIATESHLLLKLIFTFDVHIWALTQENLSSGVCELQRGRPACASAQSDQCLCYSLYL